MKTKNGTTEAETLAVRVSRLRAAKNWTQIELAGKVGCSTAYVSQLEGGVRGSRFSLDMAKSLALALNVPLGDFLDGLTLPLNDKSFQWR